MPKKKVDRILLAKKINMGGTKLLQGLPVSSVDQVDPFLLLHHFGPVIQAPNEKQKMDVGPHPHRGFEPVTFVLKGAIHHKDSRGNDSIIESGGVQWMTAGMGIIHSESLAKAFLEKGGQIEIIQLWINLPAKQKMIQPRYQGFQKDQIPSFITEDGLSKINVIAGEFDQFNGPVESITGVRALIIEMKSGGEISLSEKEARNTMIYQVDGLSAINDVQAGPTKLVTFKEHGHLININALSDSTLLYLSGNPINEEVMTYGPFVMNTQTEVMEAMRDYQMGKMGILID